MSENIAVPVLFVSEPIVLPGMVVPIELDDAARTAVDAARASESGKLLIAPRLEDRYPTYGVIASIVQLPPSFAVRSARTSGRVPPDPAPRCGSRSRR
jgi:ATP-dependent Lon protease